MNTQLFGKPKGSSMAGWGKNRQVRSLQHPIVGIKGSQIFAHMTTGGLKQL